MPPTPATTTVERPLWLTLDGASGRTPLGWLAWLGAGVVIGPLLAAPAGPAGAVLAVLAVGWLLARQLPSPLEWLRRYHLDDVEVTVMGPGRRVCRLPWSDVDTLTHEPRARRVPRTMKSSAWTV